MDQDSKGWIVYQSMLSQSYSKNKNTSESAFSGNVTMLLHTQCFLYFRGRTLLSHPSSHSSGSQWAGCPKKPGSGMELPTTLTPINVNSFYSITQQSFQILLIFSIKIEFLSTKSNGLMLTDKKLL